MKERKTCTCGFKLRGESHTDGDHHKKRAPACTSSAANDRMLIVKMKGVKTNVGDPGRHEKSCSCYQCRRT